PSSALQLFNPSTLPTKPLVRAMVLRQFRSVMAANRRLGCLSIFLFVALCASLFVNFVLMLAAFQRFGGIREAEPIPRFREILLQRGTRPTLDKIAVITMRGLISSSLPGTVGDSMVFKSGKFKDMLNGARPITSEERDLVQSFIMKTYDKFLGIVAKERKLPPDLLRNTIADGRILSGKEAFENKLIDGLGELDDAFTKAKQLGNAPEAKIVKYGPPFSLSRFLRIFGGTDSKIELQLPKQFIPQLES